MYVSELQNCLHRQLCRYKVFEIFEQRTVTVYWFFPDNASSSNAFSSTKITSLQAYEYFTTEYEYYSSLILFIHQILSNSNSK